MSPLQGKGSYFARLTLWARDRTYPLGAAAYTLAPGALLRGAGQAD